MPVRFRSATLPPIARVRNGLLSYGRPDSTDSITRGDQNDVTISSSANLAAGTYHDVTIDGCGTSVSMNGNVIITGTLTVNACATLNIDNYIVSGSGSFVLADGGRLNIDDSNGISAAPALSGSIQTTGGRTYSTAGNYVYTGTGNQVVGDGLPGTVASLTISNTGASPNNIVTGNPGQIVTGSLEVVSAVYVSASDYADVQIDTGATLSLAAPITVSGNWTNGGTLLHNGFGVTFDGIGEQTITTGGSGAGKTFAGFTISKSSGAATLNGPLRASALSIASGTFDTSAASSFAVTVTGGVNLTGGMFTANASIISVAGDWTNGNFFTPGTSTVKFNGSGAIQTISGNSTFNDLTILATGAGTVTAASSTLSVMGLLDVAAGTFASATQYHDVQIDSGGTLGLTGPISVSGNWTNNGAFSSNSQPVTFNGTSAQSINGSSTTGFSNFTDSNTSAAVTFNTNFNVSGTFNMNGAGTLFTPGSPSVQINSAGNTGTISGTGRVQVTRLSPNPFSSQYKLFTFSVTALTVEWAGASDQTIENGVAGYGGIMTSGGGTKTIGGGGTLAINGDVTIGSGTTLAQGGNSLNVAGNWSNGGTFTAGTSAVRVTFNGSGNTQTISGTNTFSNLTINHTGANSVTAAGSTLAVTGLLRVQSGTFTSATSYVDVTIDAAGTLALSGPITVSGNWTNNGGVFTPGTNGVTFNGATGQTITGNTSFYDFTKSVTAAQQFNFTAGSTTTVTHSLTLTGASGQLLTLRSTGSPTQWKLNAPTTQSVSYVDVKDSDASGGSSVTPTNSTDSGNNINWLFPPTLGTYPDTSVALGANATVTPDAAPTNATSINVSSSTNFNGTFSAYPATGVVRVTNAHPAGAYTVTVTAFNGPVVNTTRSFTLTVTDGTACTGASIFTNAADSSVGTTPVSVTIGDFNNDGKQDFAAANRDSNTVSIRLGDGAGGFSGTTNVSVGSQPYSVAIGDFNNDGKQDFAAANFNSNTVSIRLGIGDGTFTGSTNVSVGSGPYSVAIGDFNNDGKQDIAAANISSNTVSIRLGDGAGGFSGTTEVSVGTTPVSVAIGDFNNDGKQDIAAANRDSNTVSIRLGDGAGGFSGTTEVSVGSQPYSVAIGDFNNDGKQDIAAANISSNTVSIRLGDGAGGFSGTTNVSVGTNPVSVAIGDFNNDGKQDIAAANINSNTVLIRLGQCNPAPTIAAATGLSRQQGSTASNSQIATVTDDGGNGSVSVTVTSANPSNGVTISNIVNTSGNVTADIIADCTASNATFTLQASDGSSTATDTLSVTVTGNTAPIANSGGPYIADLGSGVSLNGSGSSDPNAGCGDSIVSYAWNIDSGAILLSGANPSLTAAQISALGIGGHSVALTVTDTFGATGNASTTLNIYDNRPFASFTASPNPAACSQSISFDGSASSHGRPDRAIVSYVWDFGDANIGSGVAVTHAYSAYGTYTAKLTVTDNNVPAKSDFVTHSVTVDQGNQAPVSVPGGPYTTVVGSGISLDGSGSFDPNVGCGDSIVQYNWSIDSGTVIASGANPSLPWVQISILGVGSHTVALTVTDTFGATGDASTTLTINPPPTLGPYPNTPIALGANATVTPGAAPTDTTSINVSTSTSFNGELEADPATGVVRVTNAHPAGAYTVAVKGFGPGGSTTRTFTLTVQTGTACTGVSLFTNAADSSVGSNPRSVAIGDFNNDGKQDIAAANSDSNTVSIRLGDGLGGFSGTTNVSVGTIPFSVAIGDFNGDGKQDFAAANYFSNTVVSIRLGDGLGGFTVQPDVSVGTNPDSVAIGDFNNDGKQDIAAANNSSATVSIRLGDGAGGFSGTTNVSVGANPFSVAIGDFNNDGKQDIAAANYSSNTVSIRLGDGLGGLSGTTNVSVGAEPDSVAIGDFNNDGKQDIAAANWSSNTVSIRLGDGAGGFSGTNNVSVGANPYSVAIGDFNNDGKQDIAAANSSSNTVSIRLGDGLGGFSGTTNVSVGTKPFSLAIGDFNNNGKQDIAAANLNSATVSIRLGACNLPPTITAATGLSRQQGTPASNSQIATATDDDGNGSVSVTVTSANPSNGVTISNIVNTSGNVTADIIADCTASNATFTLEASDGSSTATDTLTVTVTANSAPTLVYSNPQSVVFGGMLNVSPTTASDNGMITGYAVQAGHGLTTAPTVDASGVVSITTAQPSGAHTITIRATDNCGAFTDAAFTLNVGTMPTFTIDDVTHNEGNAGTTLYTFTVTKMDSTALSSSVNFTTVDGTATTANNDYQSQSGTLTFLPADTTKQITVLVNGDTTFEPDETFTIHLSGASGGTIADADGTSTITNDDSAPAFAIDEVVHNEGDAGAVSYSFTVTKTGGTALNSAVNFTTVDGTATTANNDYQLNAGALTFLANDTTKQITVVVNGDVTFEGNEVFTVHLSGASGATISDADGTGTITNDDGAPTFAIDDVTHNEGNAGTTSYTFTVTKMDSTALSSSVNFTTVEGTATTGNTDYQSQSGTLTFLPADTTKQITVLVNGDTTFEPDETFTVHLSGASNATTSDADGTGTMINDDVDIDAPTVNITSAPQTNSSLIEITASDQGSGVKATYYSLNGVNFQPYTGPFEVNQYQAPVIYAFSDDNVGNRSGLVAHHLIAASIPVLVTQPTSTRAIALDSVLWLPEPFHFTYDHLWGTDPRTRIMLFAMNFELTPGEDASAVTASAQDASNRIYPLTVEHVGKVPGSQWLTSVVVSMNDDIGDVGDVLVRITYHGNLSNAVRLGIGHVGGGPPDPVVP